jgi:hypothetical protein
MQKLRDFPVLLGILLASFAAAGFLVDAAGLRDPEEWRRLFQAVSRGPLGAFWFLFENEQAVIRRVQGPFFVFSIFATMGACFGLLIAFIAVKRRLSWRVFFACFAAAWIALGFYWQRLHTRLNALPRLNTVQLFLVHGGGDGSVRFQDGASIISCAPNPVIRDDDISYVECWNDGPNNSGLRLRPKPGALKALAALREKEPHARLAIVLDGRFRGTCDLGERWKGGFFKIWGFPKFRECEACRHALKW